MSSSWNFPARASPSYEGSEPSWAGALQFSSWNQANCLQISQFCSCIMISINFWSFIWIYIVQKVFLELNNMIYLHKLVIFNTSLLWKLIKNRSSTENRISARFWPIFDFELKWGRSRAEQWLDPARLGLIATLNMPFGL